MSEREDYLATRVIDDKFIALSKKNTLTTWNITTGKMISEVKVEKDYSKWEIYSYKPKAHLAYH